MKKKILILANCASGLYDFRNELLLELLKKYEVHVSLPDEEEVPEIAGEGCIVYHTPLDRRGINPIRDLKLLAGYGRLLKKIRPDAVLTYTIKPNIYGGLCCRFRKIPYIVNITGLGSVFEKGGILQKIVVFLYRISLKDARCVFFQNDRNRGIFEKSGISGRSQRLVPGSGVNLDRHRFEEYPGKEEKTRFLYVGRIMKEKGMDELLYTAQTIKKEYPEVIFEIVGNYEDDYKDIVERKETEKVICLTGYQKIIHPYYKASSAVIVPSYHEGMSNVVLEAAATGRPVLASDIPGCREGFEDGVTGIAFAPRNEKELLLAVRKFMELPYEERKQMGEKARKKMELQFDRKIVVGAYLEEISKCMNGGKENESL